MLPLRVQKYANILKCTNFTGLFSYFVLIFMSLLVKSSIFAAFLINTEYENSFNRIRKDG